MRIVFIASLITLLFSAWVLGQEKKPNLKIYAEVEEIPKSSFDDEKVPPEYAYVIIRYKVLQVLNGSYSDDEIRVAHGVGSRRKLKVGDKVSLEVRFTKEFREMAEILKESGIAWGEDSVADFQFVRFLLDESGQPNLVRRSP